METERELEALRAQDLPMDESERGSGSLSSHEVEIALARYLGVVLDSDVEYSVKNASYKIHDASESYTYLEIEFPVVNAKTIFEEARAYLKSSLPLDSLIKEKKVKYEMGELGAGSYQLVRRSANHKETTKLWFDPEKGLMVVNVSNGDLGF